MTRVQTTSALVLALRCGLLYAAPPDGPSLTVLVYAAIGPDTMLPAEVENGRILQRAGVRLRWRNCGQRDPCLAIGDTNPVFVRIVKGSFSDGLGCSFVTQAGGSNAVVAFGNVQRLARSNGIPMPQLLAAVLAHEIGHLMLGPTHSGDGLMHGSWDVRDLSHLNQGQLKFDPNQCIRMRAAVLARSECIWKPGLKKGCKDFR